MNRLSVSRISEWALLLLLCFSILWRGGKGLESTWLLAGVAGMITLLYAAKRFFGITGSDAAAGARKADTPVVLWTMVLGLTFLSIASYLHSSVQNYGLDTVLRNVSLSLIFLWTIRQKIDGTQDRLFHRFLRVITLTAIIAALVGIAVYLFQPVNRLVGTFFDIRFTTDYWPNAWASFTLLAWPLAVLQLIRTDTLRNRTLLLCGIGMLIGTLFLSYSRGALLAFVCQCVLTALCIGILGVSDIRYKRIFKSALSTLIIQTVAVTAIAVLIFVGINQLRSQWHPVQSVAEKITFTASEGTSSINERSQFWQQSFERSFDHPLLGYGPYSFRFVQPASMQHVLATSDHAHNIILNTALDFGWIAAILLVLIVLVPVWSSVRMLFGEKREWSQEKDINAVFLLVAVLGVAAHSMIDYNFQFVGIALPFWLCVGFLMVPRPRKESVATSFMHWKFSRYLIRLKIFLAILLLGAAFVEGIGLVLSSLGRHAEAAGKTTQALQWYARAKHEWFSRDMHLSEAQLYLQKDDPVSALHAIDLYMSQNALDARAWKLQAMAFLRHQDLPAATASIEKAYALGKYTDLGILDVLLQTARDPAQKEKLLTRKLEFDTLFSAYADAIEQNTHFIALSQNVEELLSVARSLSQLFPTDERRYKQIARRAADHAREERETFSAQATGMLW